MKALNLYGVGDLRYDEVPKPKTKTDEVLLKIKAVGICGSDIPRIFEKGTYNFPTIPGHEFAGEIIDAEDAKLIGRGAAVFPLIPCGKCTACRSERYAQCCNYNYYGSRCDGAMSEYLAVRVKNLALMPSNISYEAAAMCEPASVALHAIKKSGIKAGKSLLIWGIGPIALIAAQWARSFGVENIILAGRSAAKATLAGKVGFSKVINIQNEDAQDFIMQETKGQGVDACIEGTGNSEALEQCLYSVKNFGIVVAMGNPTGDIRLSQDAYWKILRKEVSVTGTWNSSFSHSENDWHEALEAMEDGRISVEMLISHKFNFKEFKQAFSLMHEKKESYCKVMFIDK
ncbi:galactitol-1-phosphate 5-dehydrogenase [Pectinatus haikarae]|uniref:galactitol-1-phosphate 5-dehydrogenase n=1 Tax=Pectinatus haikarae TaxID=349096 RepID=UPI0018C77F90|nr:galactitol-1-phosphate 5-dehydrogenase [Pectinatus haikarae]